MHPAVYLNLSLTENEELAQHPWWNGSEKARRKKTTNTIATVSHRSHCILLWESFQEVFLFAKRFDGEGKGDLLNGHIKQLHLLKDWVFQSSVVLCYLLKLSSSPLNLSLPFVRIRPALEGIPVSYTWYINKLLGYNFGRAHFFAICPI